MSVNENYMQADLVPALKQAMRGMAQSVAVIATSDEAGVRYAMAATAVTPLSMEPPSMLICINRNTSSYPILAGGAHFSVNILSAEQLDVARLCGGGAKGEERFAAGDWRVADNGVPYLADAQSAILCLQQQKHGYGSHDIFIGDVFAVVTPRSINPLVYLDGAYRLIGDLV
jgi:flavin reductase (DIM6/NTAB) family NADH-FMN oxidoreductase RutF